MPAPHRACRGSAAPGPDAGRSYLGDAHEHEPLLAAVDDDGKEGADGGGNAERRDDVKRIRVLLDARLEVHAEYAAHGGDDGEDERQRGQDDLRRVRVAEEVRDRKAPVSAMEGPWRVSLSIHAEWGCGSRASRYVCKSI